MMTKRVLEVGNCAADYAALRILVEREFGATLARAHGEHDALAALRAEPFDLVLVNRLLARGGKGLPVIVRIKQDSQFASIPVMLISDYAEYQQAAVEAGAEYGFGKAALRTEETREKLRRFLEGDGANHAP